MRSVCRIPRSGISWVFRCSRGACLCSGARYPRLAAEPSPPRRPFTDAKLGSRLGAEALKRLMRQRQRVGLLPAHAVLSHRAHIHHYPQPTTDDLLPYHHRVPPSTATKFLRTHVRTCHRDEAPRVDYLPPSNVTAKGHRTSNRSQFYARNLPCFEREHFDLAQAVCAKTTLPRSAVPLWETRHW